MSMITSYKVSSETTTATVANPMGLLPGFRFHPTDEELIVHYLMPKVMNHEFSAMAIGQVDFNKCEPWDLPKVVYTGDTAERYYYCLRDKKYPTGLRTNRATKSGYWKATGKDREIFMEKTDSKKLIGMKKTLVFYKGRAPRGEKTNWVMHEFRLHSNYFNKIPKDDYGWVISRVFHKNADGNNNSSMSKKTLITNNVTFSPNQDSDNHSLSTNHEHYHSLPPLNDSTPSPPPPCSSNHQLQDLKSTTFDAFSDEDQQLLYLTDDPCYYYPKQPETLIQTYGTNNYGADDDGSVMESFNFKVEECFASYNVSNGLSYSLNDMINKNDDDVEIPCYNEKGDDHVS